MNGRTYKQNPQITTKSELYAYDNLNRLSVMSRGDLNATKDALSGTAAKEEDYTLDAVGNWRAS